jgi:hypothetical protein
MIIVLSKGLGEVYIHPCTVYIGGGLGIWYVRDLRSQQIITTIIELCTHTIVLFYYE